MRAFWPASVAILTVACGTVPVPSSSAKPIPAERINAPDFTRAEPGRALVVVTRDKGSKAQVCYARLYIDGIRVADLRPSEQIRLFLEEGDHVIGVAASGDLCFGGADQTEVEVTRARPLLLRISAGHGQGMTIDPSAF